MRRFAYADPPYLGCAKRYYSDHPEAAVYDTLEGHAKLIARLDSEFSDGWALSCHVPSLGELLPLAPGARVGAWTKPFSGLRPGIRIRFAWEPVIYRTSTHWKYGPNVTDVHSASAPLRNGVGRPGAFIGRKPDSFASWIADLLGFREGDELVDLFPGSGAVTRQFARAMQREFQLELTQAA